MCTTTPQQKAIIVKYNETGIVQQAVSFAHAYPRIKKMKSLMGVGIVPNDAYQVWFQDNAILYHKAFDSLAKAIKFRDEAKVIYYLDSDETFITRLVNI